MTLKLSGSFKVPSGSFKAGDQPPPPPSGDSWDYPAPAGAFPSPTDYWSVSGLQASKVGGGRGGVRSVSTYETGKYYVELTLDTNPDNSLWFGLVRTTGYLYSGTQSNWASFGIHDLGTGVGRDIDSILQAVAGDVFGLAIDLDNNAIWLSRNGVYLEGATISEIEAGNTANKTTTTNPVADVPYHIALSDTSSNSLGFTQTINFGDSPFVYTVPSGFTAGWPAS